MAKAEQTPNRQYPMVDESVDKIRDLIFGEQMQAYEKRLASIEESILSLYKQLSETIESRHHETELLLNAKIDELENQLASERKERIQKLSDLDEDLRTTEQSLVDKLSASNSSLQGSQEHIQTELKTQIGALQLQLQRQALETSQLLEKEAAILRSDKVSHSSLAGMFRQIVSELDPENENE